MSIHTATVYTDIIREAVRSFLPEEDWRLYNAQLWQESRLIPTAASPAGATGIAQFMPETWEDWAKHAGFPGRPPTNPQASIHAGACYMRWLINQWSWPRPWIDRYCLALASYNAGLGNLLEAQEAASGAALYAPIIIRLESITHENAAETKEYVKNILGYWAELVTV